MSKLNIPQEIRSKISQLDDLAREVHEQLLEIYNKAYDTDEDFAGKEEEIALEELNEHLEEFEGIITSFQESQGWLDEEPNMPGPGGKPYNYDNSFPNLFKEPKKT